MNNTENYFQEDGEVWLNDAYLSDPVLAPARLALVSSLVKKLNPKSLMDVGCGDGRFLRSLSSVENRFGIDYSQSMLSLASNSSEGIVYKRIDLNSDESCLQLENLGSMDMITLLGLIHYLEKPLLSLNYLNPCTKMGTTLVVSFRNKLFNINPTSKYFNSELTLKEFSRIEEEKNLWKEWASRNEGIDEILIGIKTNRVLEYISANQTFEGATDSAWNPNGYENWRQFTPLEATSLLMKAGYKPSQIIPIDGPIDQMKVMKESQNANVTDCTSFVLVANRI